MNHDTQPENRRWIGSRSSIVLLIFLAAIGLLLFSEHRGGILPYLLLLACPFMHFLMHGNHGTHGDKGSHH
jgi:hypothetical protein